MAQIPTGSEVLVALMKDIRFTSMPEQNKAVLVPYILAVPGVLGTNLMNTKVTPSSLLRAKVVFLEYCLKNGLAEKTAELLKSAYETKKAKIVKKIFNTTLLDLPDTDELVKLTKKALEKLIDSCNETLKRLPALLQEKGEAETFLLIKMGISTKIARKCSAEGLTIGDLLLLEPATIIINTPSKNK